MASAKDVVNSLQPSRFTTVASGVDVLIYSPKQRLQPADTALLRQLEQQLAFLVNQQGIRFERAVPNAAALGNLSNLKSLAPNGGAGFDVTAEGSQGIQVSIDGTVSCNTLKQFLANVDKYAHHTKADTPVATVLYLDPAAAANAVGAAAVPFAGTLTAPTGGTPTSPAPSSTPAPAGGNTGGNTPTQGANPTSQTSGTSQRAGAATQAAQQGTGGAPITTAPAQTPAQNNQKASPAPQGTQTASPSPATPFSINGRDLLFNAVTPGDDDGITEKKRALALLDLPQPQVPVNAWTMQTSTTEQNTSGRLVNLLHETVDGFNDVIQNSITVGWRAVTKERSTCPWEPTFYHYVTQRAILDVPPADPSHAAGPVFHSSADTSGETELSACGPDQYCLGFSSITSTSPRLTDMLVAIVGSQDPAKVVDGALSKICNGCDVKSGETKQPIPNEQAIADELDLRSNEKSGYESIRGPVRSCQIEDKVQALKSNGSYLPLECFRTAIYRAGGELVNAAPQTAAQNNQQGCATPQEIAVYRTSPK